MRPMENLKLQSLTSWLPPFILPGSVLHHGPGDDGLLPQVRQLLPWHRRHLRRGRPGRQVLRRQFPPQGGCQPVCRPMHFLEGDLALGPGKYEKGNRNVVLRHFLPHHCLILVCDTLPPLKKPSKIWVPDLLSPSFLPPLTQITFLNFFCLKDAKCGSKSKKIK